MERCRLQSYSHQTWDKFPLFEKRVVFLLGHCFSSIDHITACSMVLMRCLTMITCLEILIAWQLQYIVVHYIHKPITVWSLGQFNKIHQHPNSSTNNTDLKNGKWYYDYCREHDAKTILAIWTKFEDCCLKVTQFGNGHTSKTFISIILVWS